MIVAVIDTNLFISALLGSKVIRTILDALFLNEFTFLTSEELLAELDSTARKPRLARFISETDLTEFLLLLRAQAKTISPFEIISECRDAKDNKVLACAVAGADVIVSRDKDIQILSPFRGKIEVLTPAQFLKRLAAKRLS